LEPEYTEKTTIPNKINPAAARILKRITFPQNSESYYLYLVDIYQNYVTRPGTKKKSILFKFDGFSITGKI